MGCARCMHLAGIDPCVALVTDVKGTQHRVTQEALSGRLPILSGERVYSKYVTFLWTCTAFGAATWAFLVGSYLPYVGNTVAGTLGYAAGMLIGMVPVTLAAGFPSHRYGTDTIDAAKAVFGTRGILLPMVGLLVTIAGWTYVVMALTARGAGNVIQQVRGSSQPPNEILVIGVALTLLVVVWAIASKGPWLFERLSNYIAPGHMVITVIMLAILLVKFDGAALFSINVPPSEAYTEDKSQAFAYAVEFGVANSLTWWPVLGGLSRLVKRPKQIMGPSVLGIGVLGAAFISAVAAFAGAAYGTADPTIWIIQLGGRVFGSLLMAFVLTANIATMVIMTYLGAVSIQQLRFLARIRWDIVIALILLPGVIFAFRTEWLLEKVIQWLTYDGVIFVGITAIGIVDYFILRRQQHDVDGLFAKSNAGPYWFWGGVNWIAVIVSIGAAALYLWVYNPITLATQPVFRYLGAGIPVMLIAGATYWLLTKLIAIPLGKGGYTSTQMLPNSDSRNWRRSNLKVEL